MPVPNPSPAWASAAASAARGEEVATSARARNGRRADRGVVCLGSETQRTASVRLQQQRLARKLVAVVAGRVERALGPTPGFLVRDHRERVEPSVHGGFEHAPARRGVPAASR